MKRLLITTIAFAAIAAPAFADSWSNVVQNIAGSQACGYISHYQAMRLVNIEAVIYFGTTDMVGALYQQTKNASAAGFADARFDPTYCPNYPSSIYNAQVQTLSAMGN